MIKLNTTDGSVEFRQWIFTSDEKFENIVKKVPLEIEHWMEAHENGNHWISYRLKFSDEIIFIFRYKNKKLFSIELSPLTDLDEKIAVTKLLESIGGEHKYPWGSVCYSHDEKAGYDSIIIYYI